MTIHEATFFLLKKLRSVYSESEAGQMTDWIMENLTGSRKAERMLYKNSPITDSEETRLHHIVNRLMLHEPVQYVLGEAWFAGMKFHVDRNVLIPRPETEELVEWVIKEKNVQPSIVNNQFSIIDIGTGSGCIAVTVKKKMPAADVTAIDVCSEALFVATNNALHLDADVNFMRLDFLDENKWNELGEYNVIISNPPYVQQSEADTMAENVKSFEPRLALFVPDNDSLVFYKAIAGFGKTHLAPGGTIYAEINETLGKDAAMLFRNQGYASVEIKKDMQGKDRMIKVKN